MTMGLRLHEAGVDFTIFEKGPEVGGTWRDNRYPGLIIDVPSPLYTFQGCRHPGWRRWMPRPAGDPRLPPGRREPYSGCASGSASRAEVVAATWTGARVGARDGRRGRRALPRRWCSPPGFLHHPRIPAFEGLGDFARRARPFGALARRHRHGRPPRRGRRQRLDRGPARRRTRRQGRAPDDVPADSAVDLPAARLRHPGAVARAARAGPRPQRRAGRGRCVRFADSFVGGASVTTTGAAGSSTGSRRRTFAAVRDPDLRREADAARRVRCASGRSSRPASTRSVQRDDVDVVDGGDRADRPRGRRDRRRHHCTSSTC